MIDAATREELDSCPFCEGREDRTPPETLALPEREPPNSRGWRVRVVPNLYPAFERQEVVVHSPSHKRSFAELDDEEVALVAEAWQRRRASHPDGYLHALINEGRAAGASLPHSHSQLAWMAAVPPLVTAETGVGQLDVVDEREGVVVGCPAASRVPYELSIAPAAREADAFTSKLLAPALRILRDSIRRLHTIEGRVPLNAWLHDVAHWHIELFPRLTVLAGVELGAGIYVNTLPPKEAAARLRG